MTTSPLSPETVRKILAIFSTVVEGIESVAQKFSDAVDKVIENNDIGTYKQVMPKVIVEKTEFLSVKDLTNLARAYKPVSSDGVATAIKYGKNKMGQNIVQLFLTYVNGRTLLKNKNNVLIVVSADGVSNEIKKIFGNDDVVILK